MTDECITIDSSEEDDVQIMDAPAAEPKIESSKEAPEDVPRKVPLKSIETGKSVFTALLNACKKAESSSEMDVIVNKMWKRFHQADSSYTSSANFIDSVKKLIPGATKEPYSQLKVVSDDLKFHTVKTKNRSAEPDAASAGPSSSNCDDANNKTLRTIKKLEKLVEKLQRKIAFLESKEVDLNNSSDDENSAYIQVSRYKSRICDVFRKICELRKTDSLDNCIRSKIKFSGTKIPAVNRAIEKFYNEKLEFPDFRDVLTIVEKANQIKDLGLMSYECQEIAVKAFKELGATLKRQREFEFQDSLVAFAGDTNDPATESLLLNEKLEENKKLYGNRIDEIIEKYAKKQTEDKLEPEVVPDDAELETGSDEEEEEDDVSSIAEAESNEESSAEEDEDSGEEIPFESRELSIALPYLHQMPEWLQYQRLQREREPLPSYSGGVVCQPMPGCSKDVAEDLCHSSSDKEDLSSPVSKKRPRLSSDDESDIDEGRFYSKLAKHKHSTPLVSVDLTEDSGPVAPAQLPDASKSAASSCKMVGSDLLRRDSSVAARSSGESTPTGSEAESSKQKQFVLVDVKSILQKGTTKITKVGKFRGAQDVPSGRKSSETDNEVTSSNNEVCDEAAAEMKDRPKSHNGIKIVSVSSTKNMGNAVADKAESSALVRTACDDQKPKSNSSEVAKRSTVIDLVEKPNAIKTISNSMANFYRSNEPKISSTSSSTVTSTNPNSKPLFFRAPNNQQETKKSEDNVPPWLKKNPSANKLSFPSPRSSSTFSPRPNSLRFPQPNMQYRPPFVPRISTYATTSRSQLSQQHRFSAANFPTSRMRMTGSPRPRQPLGGAADLTSQTAVAKRTMQTTQKFVKGNNIYTQTMTVVQESVLQLRQSGAGGSSNLPRGTFTPNGHGSRGVQRFGYSAGANPSRSFAPNHGTVLRTYKNTSSQNPKKNCTNDVITLD